MAIYDNPPHRVSVFGLTTGTSGGAATHAFAAGQTAVPCLISTASASEAMVYAQRGNIRVTHCVSFKASALTAALTPGSKLVADDTGVNYHVHGTRRGRQMGNIPALDYADCEELLV